MKKTLLTLALGLLFVGAAAQQAQAVQINGSITFNGGVTLNSGNVGTATAVTAWINPVVESRDGDFSVVPMDTPVAIVAPWNFNSGAIPAFWSVGGFVFNLASSAVNFQSPGFVNVIGNGLITGNGYDPTPGIWRFTSQDPSAGNPPVFSFSASNQAVPAGVPEGGSAVAMLGMGLIGLAAARKKLFKTA